MRERQKRETRAAILAAARRIIARVGFGATTTREVAREAQVSIGTVFVHFSDVDALAEALLAEHLRPVLDEAFAAAPARAGALARLVFVAERLYDSYDREPELSRQYIAASLFRHRERGPGAERFAELRAWVVAELEAGVRRGELAPVDPALSFSVFFALYFAALVGGLRGQLERPAQRALLTAALRQFFSAPASAARGRAERTASDQRSRSRRSQGSS